MTKTKLVGLVLGVVVLAVAVCQSGSWSTGQLWCPTDTGSVVGGSVCYSQALFICLGDGQTCAEVGCDPLVGCPAKERRYEIPPFFVISTSAETPLGENLWYSGGQETVYCVTRYTCSSGCVSDSSSRWYCMNTGLGVKDYPTTVTKIGGKCP
jgi:hypothetical protein